tara:strand:+ start:2097 stop:2459 length:363 start_codon:yes stop_codon:yes gene_type:complete
MPAQEPKHDWTTHGMTEREMKSRIKSHRAMATKSFEKWDNMKLPTDFLSPEFRTWVKNNPNSPWVKGGGMDRLIGQAEASLSAKSRGKKRVGTADKLSKSLKKSQLSKLQKSISKLTSGY